MVIAAKTAMVVRALPHIADIEVSTIICHLLEPVYTIAAVCISATPSTVAPTTTEAATTPAAATDTTVAATNTPTTAAASDTTQGSLLHAGWIP